MKPQLCFFLKKPSLVVQSALLTLHQESLKHFTFKMVFLLTMASAGRCIAIQALMFNTKCCHFKPHGAEVMMNLSRAKEAETLPDECPLGHSIYTFHKENSELMKGRYRIMTRIRNMALLPSPSGSGTILWLRQLWLMRESLPMTVKAHKV